MLLRLFCVYCALNSIAMHAITLVLLSIHRLNPSMITSEFAPETLTPVFAPSTYDAAAAAAADDDDDDD